MKKLLAFTSATLMLACTQKITTSSNGGTCQPYGSSGQSIGANNVVPITMGCGYVNEPCVAVKVCVPGSTTNCQIIDHVLLDTGSYGLRLFSCTLNIGLTPETGTLAKTANVTSGSSTLTSLSSVTTLVTGQTITGTGIPAGTTVVSVGGTTVAMSKTATATGTTVALNFTGNVAECVHYADGTADWGPVKVADVYLGGQKASNTPIQIVDSTYNSVPGSCGSAEISPQSAGFNGILGVGLNQYDCPTCNGGSRTAGYYNCTDSGGCSGYAAPNAVQTTNPITLLGALYNNGVVLATQDVPSINGANGITGNLILGVDTVSGAPSSACDGSTTCGNMATGTTSYSASTNLVFTTKFPSLLTDGAHSFLNSFVDSGSNLWDFANDYMTSPVTRCSDGFYCPASPVTLSATPSGGAAVTFTLINANSANYSLTAYKTLGAYFDSSNDSFDWGMPFYYGRNVFHVISGKTSTNVGAGPAWAW